MEGKNTRILHVACACFSHSPNTSLFLSPKKKSATTAQKTFEAVPWIYTEPSMKVGGISVSFQVLLLRMLHTLIVLLF